MIDMFRTSFSSLSTSPSIPYNNTTIKTGTYNACVESVIEEDGELQCGRIGDVISVSPEI